MALVQSILVKPKAGVHMCFRKQLFWKRRKNHQKIFVVEFTTKRDLDCCFTRKFSNLLNAASINNFCFNQSCVCRTTLPVGWPQKSECGYYFQESVTYWVAFYLQSRKVTGCSPTLAVSLALGSILVTKLLENSRVFRN